MTKAQNYPDNTYLSPAIVEDRFRGLSEKHGEAAIRKLSRFKHIREAWVTACFALGLRILTGKEYWVGINKEDSTPDTYLISIRELEKGQALDIHNIEVFDWEENSKVTLVEAIKAKLSGKAYPAYFILVCHVYNHFNEQIILKEIYEAVKVLNPKVAEIWMVSSVVDVSNDYGIVKLYPDLLEIRFVHQTELAKTRSQKEFVKPERGLGKGFYDKGNITIPLE